MSLENDERHWAIQAAEVEQRMYSRIPESKIRPRLEPTRRAVEMLGDPQAAYRVVHVTGTNGKTSTTRFIERILREHGLRTGRFLSPHLVKLNERMAIDGESVSDERLVTIWNEIEPILELVDSQLEAEGEHALTFFEALAVLAFAVFADAPVDVLVLEVGIGGEWDSTNVANGDVAVFAPISLDHTDRIGGTLAEIAQTKAGIIKPGAYVVSATQPIEAAEILEARANEIGEQYRPYGSGWHLISSEAVAGGTKFSVQGLAGEYHDLFLPLHGSYQAENAALALVAAEAFMGGGEQRIMDDIVRAAFADASSPGRLQIVSKDPLIVLDAAHNPSGAQSLAVAVKETFNAEHVVGVVSILAEKDAESILRELEPAIDQLIVTQSSSPRAIELAELEAMAVQVFGAERVSATLNPWHALERAKVVLPKSKNAMIVASGSITLVGDILKQLQREEDSDD
jgi:dihydrofolate synthase / folylpolyglutamate synthase